MEGIDYIETESDLLDDYKIWNETCSSKIFSFISKYAPLIEDNTCDTVNLFMMYVFLYMSLLAKMELKIE